MVRFWCCQIVLLKLRDLLIGTYFSFSVTYGMWLTVLSRAIFGQKIYIFWWKWPIISYVYKSCCSGYSIVTHGPKSDFKNVACETNSAIFSSSDLNLSGTYGIRIESRENNELGNGHNFLPLYITVLNGFVQEKWFPGSCISRLVLLSWSTWYRSWTNLSYDRGIVDE